jgi:hypothetical protein
LSFQITILKVLAGYPGGRASLDELRHAVSFLISSGSDWTNRMKRLALIVPDLDIFERSLVMRDQEGWHITDAGRQFLTVLEAAPVPATSENQPAIPAAVIPPRRLRLIGIRKRVRRRSRGEDRNRRSVA